jgi:hypothetical protein
LAIVVGQLVGPTGVSSSPVEEPGRQTERDAGLNPQCAAGIRRLRYLPKAAGAWFVTGGARLGAEYHRGHVSHHSHEFVVEL